MRQKCPQNLVEGSFVFHLEVDSRGESSKDSVFASSGHEDEMLTRAVKQAPLPKRCPKMDASFPVMAFRGLQGKSVCVIRVNGSLLALPYGQLL